MAYDDIYRLSTARDMALNSVGGAVTSSSVFGTETYAVGLCFPGSVSSTGGVRVAVVDNVVGASTVSSTQGAFLPANWPLVVKVTPGQRVSAISNDAGTPSLNITELTK